MGPGASGPAPRVSTRVLGTRPSRTRTAASQGPEAAETPPRREERQPRDRPRRAGPGTRRVSYPATTKMCRPCNRDEDDHWSQCDDHRAQKVFRHLVS